MVLCLPQKCQPFPTLLLYYSLQTNFFPCPCTYRGTQSTYWYFHKVSLGCYFDGFISSPKCQPFPTLLLYYSLQTKFFPRCRWVAMRYFYAPCFFPITSNSSPKGKTYSPMISRIKGIIFTPGLTVSGVRTNKLRSSGIQVVEVITGGHHCSRWMNNIYRNKNMM